MAELRRCAVCRTSIEPGQNVVFRADRRVEHATCPEVICPVCERSIRPTDPIRRDGETMLHGNCWMRRVAIAVGQGGSTRRAAVVRAKVHTGNLPASAPIKMWAGYGTGSVCDGCGDRIAAREVEHEVDFSRSTTLRLHAECLGFWQEETRKRLREISGGSARCWPPFFDVRVAAQVALLAGAADARATAAQTRVLSRNVRAAHRLIACCN